MSAKSLLLNVGSNRHHLRLSIPLSSTATHSVSGMVGALSLFAHFFVRDKQKSC
jgi:hypothetical protein